MNTSQHSTVNFYWLLFGIESSGLQMLINVTLRLSCFMIG